MKQIRRLIQKTSTKKWAVLRKLLSLVLLVLAFRTVKRAWRGGNRRSMSTNTPDTGSSEDEIPFGYLVKTRACAIPDWTTHKAVDSHSRDDKVPDCSRSRKFVEFSNEEEMIISLAPGEKECSIHEIQQGNASDRKYSIASGEPFTSHFNVRELEFFAVNCSNELQFEARLIPTSAVREKMSVWERRRLSIPLPVSILVIGISSTSRAHFFRSLPQTVRLLQRLNFTDFKGYHAVSVKLYQDFASLLTGMNEEEFKGELEPKPSTVDEREFLWKYFDSNEYVTMYNDDSDFLYDKFDGFKFQPTDFFTHPLYSAQKAWASPEYGEPEQQFCMSSESIPQFSLRYLRRFLHRFAQVPFVSVNWLDSPLKKTRLDGLRNLDDDFVRLLRDFQGSPSHLERTMVIITSDHGPRHGFPQVYTVAGSAERVLPPLFIRLPDDLARRLPDSQKIFSTNSRRFTSFQDVHATILHVLSLDFPDYFGPNFRRFAPSGRPLYADVISPYRGCESVQIYGDVNCACKLDLGDGLEHKYNSTKLFNTIINFTMTNFSKFWRNQEDICYGLETAQLHSQPFLGAELIRANETHQKVLLSFKLQNSVELQTTIWVSYTKNSSKFEFQRVGGYERLDGTGTLCNSVG